MVESIKGEGMARMVEKKKSGERFIETDIRGWARRLDAWRADRRQPCPMPKGHLMFVHPQDYGCVRVEEETVQRPLL